MLNIEVRFKSELNNGDYLRVEPDHEFDKCLNVLFWCEESQVYRSCVLNESTAIKLAKTLRTEINKIKE